MSALEYAPAYASPAPRRRRRLSREAAVAIGLSLLVHGAVGLYLATQKFAEIQAERIERRVDITTERLPPPAPPKSRPDQPKPVTIRDPVVADPAPQDVKPLEAPPTPPAEADERPAIIAADPQPRPVQIAEARPPEPPRPRVIRNPSWLQRPTGDQLARLYPRMAAERGLAGGATLMCEVIGTGAVRNCEVIDESPKGRGFGEAALASAKLFKLNPRTVDGQAVEGAKVRIPLVFNLAE